MLKLLVIFSLQHSLSCCIFEKLAEPVISRLHFLPNEHILQKRQVQSKDQVLANDYNDLNIDSKVAPYLQELNSVQQQSKDFNEEKDEVDGKIVRIPFVKFMPEAQTADLPPYPETNMNNTFADPVKVIDNIDLMKILNDLSDCVELNRVQTLRLCPSKRKNDKTQQIQSRFEKLSDEQLQSKIEKKCKTVNALLEKTSKEFKESVTKNRISSDVNGSNENTPDESLSNDELPSNNKIIAKFMYVSPEHNVRDGNILIDYKKHEGNIIDGKIKDTANITTSESPEEATQAMLNDMSVEQTNNSYTTQYLGINQNILDNSGSTNYDATTINVQKTELENALGKLFKPTEDIMGKLKSEAQISKNITLEEMLYTTGEDKRPILENFETYKEHIKDNSEIAAFENIQDINTRRSYLRPHANENEVPVIKIITHEYANGNVVSKVNGTEILINNDDSSVENYTNIFVKNINVQDNDNVSEVLYKFSIPKHIPENGEFDPESHKEMHHEVNFIGHLYLIHNNEKIPAQFIQESDGNLSVGLDILSICKTENYDPSSVLLKLLCKCENCSSEIY